MFEPIAVVGRGCVLPGALSPDALWQAVASGRDGITAAPPGSWRLDHARVLPDGQQMPAEGSFTDRGGYVGGFAQAFDPSGFAVAADRIMALDPLFQWLLHSAREALRDAGMADLDGVRSDILIGNLSYPIGSLTRLAEETWLAGAGIPSQGRAWENRFMSGFPAHLVAAALRARGSAAALDAACASSLYAIKLGCDRLQDRDADLVLAGAVNHADDLFLHAGFTAFQALSRSGRSRPFHRDADGLLPAEGAAVVALKRLADAEAAGDRIHGVIRGIGLSNDGRKGGFLAPDGDSQVRAMRAAYAMSGLDPAGISLLECHATGTAVGDAVELRSAAAVFAEAEALPIGSLKSNFGHLVTASGMASLLKVMGAFAHGLRPPTLHVDDPAPELRGTPLQPLQDALPWDVKGPRRAAINNFGFGGNNAHLIVEAWQPERTQVAVATSSPPVAIAICGIGVVAGPCHGLPAFARRLFGDGKAGSTRTEQVVLPLEGLRFPPKDLQQSLAQQMLMLEAALEAAAALGPVAPERAGVIVGMGCDAEVCRYGLRWRLADLLAGAGRLPDRAWLAAARDAVSGRLDAAGALGAMPNVPANRLNVQFDWRAFGFTVSGEELSGLDGLRVAARALRHGEIDTALVGAVDLSCEPVHEAAAAAVLPADRQRAGDAAVALVLKRLDDARRQGDRIYALLPDPPSATDPSLELSLGDGASLVTDTFGHAHAASGLLHVAAAALACASAARPAHGGPAAPWLDAARTAAVTVRSFSGQQGTVTLITDPETPARSVAMATLPLVRLFAGADRSAVARHLDQGREGKDGPARLAIVAADREQLASRMEVALALLRDPAAREVTAEGIHYRDRPIEGELAFVFTGAAAAYPGMGRDVMLALPELGQQLALQHGVLGPVADRLYRADPALPLEPLDQLRSSALLCQAHALLARSILGLRPQAVLGLSSGETNALFAFGAWRDMGAMFEEIVRSGIYGRELTGECRAAAQAWGLAAGTPVAWRNWRLLAPLAAVEQALADEPRATITIVNAPDDCVIGGDAEACGRVIRQVGRSRAIELGQDMVVHCAEMSPCAELWRRIHDRETHAVGNVRFYTNATGTYYRPDRNSASEALLGQALQPIDFRRTVEAAWRDGVRIFVELGPRNALCGAIDRTLHDREHLALAMDRPGHGGLANVADLAAQLFSAGTEVDLEALRSRLPAASDASADARVLRLAAHPPPIALPPLPARPDIELHDLQPMPPAPALPPVAVLRLHAAVARPPALAAVPRQVAAARPTTPPADSPVLRILAQTAGLHRSFIDDQARLHRKFLDLHGPSAATISPPQERAALPAPAAAPSRAFSRAELEILASGRISQVLGPLFEGQDGYRRQVRMPEPPLLLVDRVTRIEGEPGGMGLGTIWTETDIAQDAWYLHHGRVPPGILIESGQADLLLISWLGVDALNRGERVYRLLGCELTFHEGSMPRPGDTLRYDIHVDGHAKTGDVRLFFFHYDCRVGDRSVLSVRNGQAGFFTDEELAGSGGVLWSAETDPPKPDARLDPLPGCSTRRSFSREQVDAFVAGDAYGCFGAGFEMAAPHQRTPSPPSGRMHLIDTVPVFDPAGGPWGRGYLCAEATVTTDTWFYGGHFKNDPCMPGTLMADAAVQALAFTMAAQGFTVARDGWRFEAVPDEPRKFLCRGQVVPDHDHLLTYEVFVEEVIDGPRPRVYAALLCSADGFKVFQCRRFGLQLVPDWPLGDRRELLAEAGPPRPLRADSDVRGDYAALLACAWGAPSEAFGTMYSRFDAGRVPRLPGPPYHFIARIAAIDYPPGEVRIGATVEAEYDVPSDAWYFAENGHRVMPFGVLMEVLLQPCGWLASSLGFALASADELCFRNLDGDDAAQQREVLPACGTLRVRTTLTRCSRAGAMALVFFRVQCSSDDGPVLELNTSFGFFDPAALRNQVGLPVDGDARAQRDAPSDVLLDLAQRPEPLYGRHARLAGGRLRMIDAITGYWPEGGDAGLGRIRGRQQINPESWYFKAHFYQDPVQPGSLGVEALLQLLQAYMLLHGLDAQLARPRFQAIALGEPLVWKYRGQVVPTNHEVITELEITRIERAPSAVVAVAKGSLWVDGLRIYEVANMAMRLVGEAKHAALPKKGGEIAIREHVARKVGVHPSQIRIAGEAATCPSVPLSSFPFRVERDGADLTVIDADLERLDLDPVAEFWRRRPGLADSPVEQVFMALVRRFLRRLTLADPAALDAVRGRPVMFLGNHQVAMESPIFATIGAAINARPIVTIAKQEHRASWLGTLLEILACCPGVRMDRALMFFDRDDGASLLSVMAALKIALSEEGLSLMVHAEGTRSLQCRRPVAQVSGVLLDLAIAADLPIVPIRFAGGLPVEPAARRLEFPLGLGKQEIHIGAPIAPQELAALPLAPRKQRVLAAMNALGPDLMTETPSPPDAAFASGVARLTQKLAIPERQATVLHMLQRDEHCHGGLRELVDILPAGGMPAGEGREADWLRKLGAWFTTPC